MNEMKNLPTQERDNGYTIMGIGLFVGIALGALFGALILSILQYSYYVYIKPDTLKDAQWAMVFLATIPIGGVIGAILGAVAGVFLSRRA